ncbi:MAG: polyprenyl synthetase family protein [Bdellovibrionales bacterium]|nr:polyprenyl synthetase family protein [Bdellovibrionales bacterium]
MQVSESKSSGENLQGRIGPAASKVVEAFASVAPGLKLVEERIKSCLKSDAELLEQIPQYLLNQGGKRIRPTVALLVGQLFGLREPSQQLVDVSAGIEMIHMATLLHDDIIDESPTRRHKRSAFVEFGMMPSLLAGDFLLVRAFGLCAKLDQFIIEQTERTCVELTEGEILEGVLTEGTTRTFEEYLDVVSKKTASLFGLAGMVGAHLSTHDAEITQQLGQFGYLAGTAFQMIDDILDVTADEDLLGKPAGTDLRQRTPSLVNIIWLQSGDPYAKEFFSKDNIEHADAAEALKHLSGSNLIAECQGIACDYAAKARSVLEQAAHADTNNNAKEQLLAIIDYTLERCL